MPTTSLQPPEVTIYEASKYLSEYTPKMLKSTKHKALKLKRKAVDDDDTDDLKSKLVKLKIELLEREEKREEKNCEMRMKREEELHAVKMQNQLLLNEKLKLEISLLKNKIAHN
ncbi:hypothetical protein FQA39_LY07490 [Lamprigera yunnana]|nr:hypothetical protein FQA39_LY07490 [Lamprigera yunnana]